MATRCFRKRVMVCSLLAVLALDGNAQQPTLDQKAWNAVWDRLETYVPDGTHHESVHTLQVLVPATWGDGNKAGLLDLQKIAGAIPSNTFSIDPSRMNQQLHRQYAAILLDVSIPGHDPESARLLATAQREYGRAYTDYLQISERFLRLWDAHAARLERRGEPVNTAAMVDFELNNGGMFMEVDGRLQEAADRIQQYSPTAEHYASAIRTLRESLVGSRLGEVRGIFSYEGGTATLNSMQDCPQEDSTGWEEMKFTQSTDSTSIRSSGWNAGGSWSGSFFSAGAGGGGSNYEKVIKTADDYISLRFCNPRYVPLRPGPWFDVAVLQAIDRGELEFKRDSPHRRTGKKVFGPDGLIPYFVKGIIVARQLDFKAKLDTDSLEEVKRTSSGRGGFRAGPIRIGGGGGNSSFSSNRNTQSGEYGRSTASDVPLIIAIITEPT